MQLARNLFHSTRDDASGEGRGVRTLVISAVVTTVALAVAIVGAVVVGSGSGIDSINLFVERLSSNSGNWLGGLIGASALFALAAGMTSAVNPCGFAMLPAYLGMYLGEQPGDSSGLRPIRQLGRALLIGGSVTAGFLVLFGVAGGLIGVGASFVGDLLPWLGLVIGIGLVVMGAWLIGGGNIYQYTGFAARAASNIGGTNRISARGYFMFGLSYGAASLGCTLPIFLAVVGISVADTNVSSVVSNFFLFALGMGIVILALTLGIAFFKGTMVGIVRKALPYVQPFGSFLMVVAGAYLVFYWLTIGDVL